MPEISTKLHRTFSEELISAWRELVAKGQHAQPFYQPEWFLAFARSFGAGYDTHTVTVNEGSRLVAVLPLMRKGSFFGGLPARVLSSLSGLHSCRFDFITEAGEGHEIAAAAWRAIASDRTWDVVEALDVPKYGSFERLVRGARREGFLVGSWTTRKSPVLRIPPVGSDPYQNCPTSFRTFRKRLAKKLDKLRLRGDVSFRVDTAAYEDALARFLLLESSGWKGKNRSAIASNAQSTGFYSAVVESLHQRGQLRLYSLCLNGKPISMHLGLMMEGVYYSPKVAYDEDFSSFAPGHLLVQYIIRDLADSGGHTFEFLGPRAQWKQVWAEECVEHSNWYIFRASLRGRCLHALTMRIAPRLRSLRQRVRGDPQSISFGG
jgi:CelD/BcsL family acetyltransferase involved in cellulose biosynthesis